MPGEDRMNQDEAKRGNNFTCFHAGPKEGWAQFRLEPPDVPIPVRGKVFLRNLLGSAGLEMSLNVVPPGKSMPFLHRHQQNEEGMRSRPEGDGSSPANKVRQHRVDLVASGPGEIRGQV